MKKTSKKILIVDDEVDIQEILAFNLEREGYLIEVASSAEEALKKLDNSFSLILLDVMMEGMSGFKMADKLRKEGNKIPIVFLTAKNTENDLLTGFSIGGDDYIKKPFSIREVVARVQSVLTRSQHSSELNNISDTILQRGPLTIDLEAMTVHDGEKYIKVTKTEYDLLVLLASNEGRIFTRAEILKNVWHDSELVLERTVDVHITRLRKKLNEYSHLIVNRVGFGYTFRSSEEES